MTFGPGIGPYRSWVELLCTTPSQSEIGRSVGLGVICTLRGLRSADIRVRSRVVRVVYVCVDGL